ncbi:hypothetical protein GCM10017673_53020 [Streptosporangium violaceochromogenes]|nr:hypothetical protein GCM10017673_53020 [Streptosporangium violaceochromogenes]
MGDIRSTSRLLREYQHHTAWLEELRGLLHERLAAARAELDSLTVTGHPLRPQSAGGPVPPPRDGAERAGTAVAEIEAAIERLDVGVYGTCRRCGTFIPLHRLRRVPHTRYCVGCGDAGEATT